MNKFQIVGGVFLLAGIWMGAGQLIAAAPPASNSVPPMVATTNGTEELRMFCLTCNGNKMVTVEREEMCRACGGTGKIKSAWSKTESTCNFCQGRGKILRVVQKICPSCHGRGTITPEVAAQFQTCPQCKGVRQVEVDVKVKCQNCGGTGKLAQGFSMGGFFGSKNAGTGGGSASECPVCGGKGMIEKKITKPCPICYGAGVVLPSLVPPNPAK